MTEKDGARRAPFKARVEDMFEGMAEGERDALRMNFPFPDPEDAGTVQGAKERIRRHPRRKGSLKEFIKGTEDSE